MSDASVNRDKRLVKRYNFRNKYTIIIYNLYQLILLMGRCSQKTGVCFPQASHNSGFIVNDSNRFYTGKAICWLKCLEENLWCQS